LGTQGHDHVEGRSHIRAKTLRPHDAGDGERHSFQDERASDDVSRPTKTALPEPIANDGDRSVRPTPAAVVLCSEGAAQDRPNTEAVEVLPARPETVHQLSSPVGCQAE